MAHRVKMEKKPHPVGNFDRFGNFYLHTASKCLRFGLRKYGCFLTFMLSGIKRVIIIAVAVLFL